MSPDRLISGNAYFWQDHDGQARTALFQRVIRTSDGTLAYSFRVLTPGNPRHTISLTRQQVLDNISRFNTHVKNG